MLNKILLPVLFTIIFVFLDAKTSPYAQLDTLLPYSESDFFKNEKELGHLIRKHKIKTIIEIGSWFGKSTLYMAKQMEKGGKIYAIDSWIGYPRETYEITRHVYERFLSNVIHENLKEKIIPIRMTSLTANRKLKKQHLKVDLIYIDGDHAYEAVYSDLKAWRPLLKKGGILCGNLYAKTPEESATIQRAVEDFCQQNQLKVKISSYFWKIEK